MEFKELLEKSKMSMKDFSENFGIPYRTVQHWKSGTRVCPGYILELISYRLEKEEQKMRREDVKAFLEFLHNDSDNDILKFPYSEEMHGFAIGLLYAEMTKRAVGNDASALITQMDYWHKIHNAVLKRYKETNSKMGIEDKRMKKLAGYVFTYFPSKEELVSKVPGNVQDAIIWGLNMMGDFDVYKKKSAETERKESPTKRVEWILEELKKGRTQTDIAAELGVSKQRVNNILREYREKEVDKMTKEKEIEILMEDGCTREDAKRHLEVGTVVYEDFEEHIEDYLKELCRGDEDFEEELKKMVETKEPAPDWGIVELDEKTYYIMYCL